MIMNKEIQYQKTGFDELDKLDIAINLSSILPEKFSKVSVERIFEGNVNRNFKINADHKRYFCKIAPMWYKKSLWRETWALKRLKKIGCRVPNVVKYFDKSNKALPGYEILLLEYIDGVLLIRMKNISMFYENIIDLYNSIHSINMKQYGWLDERFVGQNKTWKDFLLQIENEKSISQIGNKWIKNLAFVRNEIENYNFNIGPGKLLYGDFNYYNFIINQENKLVAFDFQNCFSGDSLYDVGMILAKDLEFEKHLHRFKTFYSANKNVARKSVLLYSLRYLLSMLAFYIAFNNKERILFAKRRFSMIKKLYEKC